ncbi:hypothetical protein CRYUN_Cryun37aG0038900 [Craigia yunnanensis]
MCTLKQLACLLLRWSFNISDSKTSQSGAKGHGPSSSKISKLMEGVVFVLSGFVNPERSTLRSQALAMGAEYQPDWNSNCTFLVCAFQNTPKFRQVEADCGTIVSKPESYEIKQIAGEGILTCLQDAIDCLVQKQDVQQIMEQWSFVPHVVKKLAIFEGSEPCSLTKEVLLRKAKVCKQIYEDELSRLDGDSSSKNRKPKTDGGEEGNKGGTKASSRDTAGYDSEETIEMTEEEVDLAYQNFASETL